MKVKPVSGFSPSSNRDNREQNRDRLIYLIDELILASSNINDSLRISTSTGITNLNKCVLLHDKLKGNSDDRSKRICNLLERVIKTASR
jgi:hypothetical protein